MSTRSAHSLRAPAHPSDQPASPQLPATWTTSLFSGAPAAMVSPENLPAMPADAPSSVSPRTAYQLALYRRALLIDVRTVTERRHEGVMHPSLTSRLADAVQAGRPPELILLGGCPTRSARIAAALTRLGAPRVRLVDGGFVGWHRAGLPRLLPTSLRPAA